MKNVMLKFVSMLSLKNLISQITSFRIFENEALKLLISCRSPDSFMFCKLTQ